MKKEKYIKDYLKKNIKLADKTISELEKELKDILKLPNNCKGIIIDGLKCENNNYKIDTLTNHYHVIGYMNALKENSKKMLDFNKMSDKDFQEFLKEQEEIKIHNDKVQKELKDLIKRKIKNKK